MKRAVITFGVALTLGTAFVARACPPAAPVADGRPIFLEAASPRLVLTAISIL